MDIRKILMSVPMIDRNSNADKDVYTDGESLERHPVKEAKSEGVAKKGPKAKAFKVLPKLDDGDGEITLKTIIKDKPKTKVIIEYLRAKIEQIEAENASDSD